MTEKIVNALQTQIEARLAGVEPEVEVLLAEVAGPTLRLFIDHPDGVTLELCERVSGHLGDFRERYALEVSSPGESRPLTKPEHFSRFVGRRVKVRLDEPTVVAARSGTIAEPPSAAGPRAKSIVGELVGATDSEVTLAAAEGVLTIPFDHIVRSNLVPGD
ncbi:MAG TPA: ribosome maturation factor RimP [Solirubrobacteraceae bacterium]|nr:ribosome maturation factor RimP [Solirubrobacteraceae bacterium]